jgi:hypothetical protein
MYYDTGFKKNKVIGSCFDVMMLISVLLAVAASRINAGIDLLQSPKVVYLKSFFL